MFDIILTSRSG